MPKLPLTAWALVGALVLPAPAAAKSGQDADTGASFSSFWSGAPLANLVAALVATLVVVVARGRA